MDDIARSVDAADAVVEAFFRFHFEPATVYVHFDEAQVASTACVTRPDRPFFAGSIFLIGTEVDDAGRAVRREALIHAVTHHALTQKGLRGPAWLQEGLAMLAATEVWWLAPELGLRAWGAAHRLPFATMVDVSPHTASPRAAAAMYYQSLTMVQAVNHARGEVRLAELVEAVARRQIMPEDAFAWAIGGDPTEQERAWQAAVENQVVAAGYFRNTPPAP